MNLRPYQQTAVDQVRAAYASGRRAPLLVLPTGAGKTFCFSYIAAGAAALGKRILILVHRRELLDQASRSLSQLGVEHGVIAPMSDVDDRVRVVVASVQTLDVRLRAKSTWFDMVIIDEAHHAVASVFSRVLKAFPYAKLLGVTATPSRLDGRGLGVLVGGWFDALIEGPSIAALIKAGHLVKPVVLAHVSPKLDLAGLKTIRGDFPAGALAERVDRADITGDAVDHYLRHAPGEPAIAFCASIKHATHVAVSFSCAGVAAEVVHGKMLAHERQAALDGLASGRISVLCSVDLISEGTDIPVCSVAILLRPTQSRALYLQQVGRILRTAPGKTRGLVLDHVGNCLVHGLPDDEQTWTLNAVKKKQAAGPKILIKQCQKCFKVYEAGAVCPWCGFAQPKVEAKPMIVQDGELREVTKYDLKEFRKQKTSAYRSAQTYREVVALTKKFGDKPGFAYTYWTAREFARRRSKK